MNMLPNPKSCGVPVCLFLDIRRIIFHEYIFSLFKRLKKIERRRRSCCVFFLPRLLLGFFKFWGNYRILQKITTFLWPVNWNKARVISRGLLRSGEVDSNEFIGKCTEHCR